MFSVVTAINACGYDQELGNSDPVRTAVRADVAQAVNASERARATLQELCTFYRDHAQADNARTLAQYVSLALNLGEPPAFAPTQKEADLPPDAAYVLGMVPLLQRFYASADLHQVWLRHQAEYNALVERFSPAITNMLLSTDLYLKMPVSGAAGRRLMVFLEPMAAPGQVNSRNYAADYYMAVSPDKKSLPIASIRHVYLHFTLDPQMARRGSTLKRLEPLLDAVKTAPMEESFKNDIALLVTESLIRAIEARTSIKDKGKQAEAERARLAAVAAQEGLVLAPFFEQQLAEFERGPESFADAFPNWLRALDLSREKKRAGEIVFVAAAPAANPHGLARPKPVSLLDQAEKRLAAGETKRAHELAQQALDEKKEDPGRALFILAQIAAQDKNMTGAIAYFERALEATRESRTLAWSHIYLGRIYDLREERDSALQHYRAALTAGDQNPATRAAAERGIAQPYAPPAARSRSEQPDEE